MGKRYTVIWFHNDSEVGRRTCYDWGGARNFADQQRKEGYSVEIE